MNPAIKKSNDNNPFFWILLIVLFIFSLTAGIFGYQKYFSINGEEFRAGRAIYRTLQLFTLEGGDLEGTIPCILQAVRFSAPFTTILAIVMALLEIFSEQWKLFRVRRMRNHVVIVGFGMKGKNIMKDCQKENKKVLVIDNDPQNPNLASIKSKRCRLLIGDATITNILKKARVTKAKSVFLLMGEDTRQVKSYFVIAQLFTEKQKKRILPVRLFNKLIARFRKKEKPSLQLFMHLRNKEFLHTMRSQDVVKKASKYITLRIFNVYENSAIELFANNPPDGSGIKLNSQQYVQMIIMGLGQTGEALALQTAYTGHYLNGMRPRVLIIDRLANQKVPEFLERYPTYQKYCKLKHLNLDTHSPQLIRHVISYLDQPNALTTMVVCFDESEYNILLGQQLQDLKSGEENRKFEVFARINDAKLLSTLAKELKPFALPSTAYSKEIIMEEGSQDNLAKKIYETFHKDEKNMDWEALNQEDKDSNRKAADHLGVKMRGIGCKIKDKDPEGSDNPATFSKEEIELLARLEHKRWCAEKFLAGWIYDQKDNDNERKNSKLVEWKKLPNEIKEKNRKAIKDIPDVLHKSGKIAIRLPEETNHQPQAVK